MFSLLLLVQTTPIARPSLVSAARFSPRSEPERLGLGGYSLALRRCALLMGSRLLSDNCRLHPSKNPIRLGSRNRHRMIADDVTLSARCCSKSWVINCSTSRSVRYFRPFPTEEFTVFGSACSLIHIPLHVAHNSPATRG